MKVLTLTHCKRTPTLSVILYFIKFSEIQHNLYKKKDANKTDANKLMKRHFYHSLQLFIYPSASDFVTDFELAK